MHYLRPSPPALRPAASALLGAVFLVALASGGCSGGGSTDDTDDTDDADAEAFCTELAESQSGCWNDDLDEDCRERYAECGEAIAVMESCPVQLACAR